MVSSTISSIWQAYYLNEHKMNDFLLENPRSCTHKRRPNQHTSCIPGEIKPSCVTVSRASCRIQIRCRDSRIRKHQSTMMCFLIDHAADILNGHTQNSKRLSHN